MSNSVLTCDFSVKKGGSIVNLVAFAPPYSYNIEAILCHLNHAFVFLYTVVMAESLPPRQQDCVFRFENVVVFKDEDSQLGVGSYGAVYKAKCDQLPCAAKILHPVLFQTNDPGSQRILERFEQECGFLSSIRHPNIVQYLGVCRDRDSRLPVLLMELLDSSLTKYLEKSNKPLPHHVEVDLCFDIVLAIAYLHSNGIIHRDLSGNNVLIVAGSRAKVTDFGMSKLMDASSRITRHTLTQCPGTEVYMAPEALRVPPVYTKMLDCFSFGVIVIQLLTRLYPNPGPRSQLVPFASSPTGQIDMPVIDTERYKEQIGKIAPTHPLLPVATECLKYNQEDRPSAQQLCEQLATLKEAPQYSESKQRMEENSSTAGNEMTDKDRTIRELQQQVKERDHMIQENNQVIRSKSLTIQDNERNISDKVSRMQNNDKIIVQLQQTLAQREKEIQDLRECLSARDSDINDPQHQLQHLRVEQPQAKLDRKMAEKRSIKLRWRDGGRAPVKMIFGSCTVDVNTVYFGNFNTKYAYGHNPATGKWGKLPNCPLIAFTLVTVNGLLTAVGGYDPSGNDTNKLLSVVGEELWTEKFPCMPTKRYNTAVVCSSKTLVVIGGLSGLSGSVILKTVELMDIDSLQWFIASELPHPLHSASATLCGDNLYLVGGLHESSNANQSVLTCSLHILIKSAKPVTLGGRLKKALSQTQKTWREVASLPVHSSTCASLNGHLIAVGGKVSDSDKRTNSVYAYDPTTDQWNTISTMPTARSHCLVAVLPDNQLIVVGGLTSSRCSTDKVEVAIV